MDFCWFPSRGVPEPPLATFPQNERFRNRLLALFRSSLCVHSFQNSHVRQFFGVAFVGDKHNSAVILRKHLEEVQEPQRSPFLFQFPKCSRTLQSMTLRYLVCDVLCVLFCVCCTLHRAIRMCPEAHVAAIDTVGQDNVLQLRFGASSPLLVKALADG